MWSPRSSEHQQVAAIAILLLVPIGLYAQTPGLPPFGTIDRGVYDTIKINDGSVLLDLPVRSKFGIMPFNFSLLSNVVVQTSGVGIVVTPGWTPRTSIGLTRGVGVSSTSSVPLTCNGQRTVVFRGWQFTDGFGTVHQLHSLQTDNLQCEPQVLGQFTEDGSGYFVVINPGQSTGAAAVYDRSGNLLSGSFLSSLSDPNGNTTSYATNCTPISSCTTFTTVYSDPAGTTPITETYFQPLTPGVTKSDTYTWADAAGRPQSLMMKFQFFTFRTNFGCPSRIDSGPLQLDYPVSVAAPEGNYTISYESTPGYPGDVTGRISKITFPSGASIAYSYTGGSNGITCTLTTLPVPILTRTLTDSSGKVHVWKYDTTAVMNGTVVTDPMGNDTVYNFATGSFGELTGFETQRRIYQGPWLSGAGHLLQTAVTCYDGNTTNCATASIDTASHISPVTQKDVYTTYAGSSVSQLTETKYDILGNLTEQKTYDFGAVSPTTDRVIVYNNFYSSNPSVCPALPKQINDRVCTDTTTDGSGSIITQYKYTYDQVGNLLTSTEVIGGSSVLTTSFTRNANGTTQTSVDANGATRTYSYADCNGTMPTGVTVTGAGVSLSRSQSWNCDGGVPLSATDWNSKTTTYNYTDSSGNADPYWRIKSIIAPFTDSANTTTNFSYAPTSVETSTLFNGGSSIVDRIIAFDGFGHTIRAQTLQGPGKTSYDTTSYGYDLDWNANFVSIPCSKGLGSDCSVGTSRTYDALQRPVHIQDGGGGTKDYVYSTTGNKYDVLLTVGPAPAGENTKKRQMEYDGIGRLTSVCEVLSSGGTACGQGTPASGYFTSYGYSFPSSSVSKMTVTQGVQTRNYTYDGLGRLISETNPESGNSSYTYDSDSSGVCPGTSNGDLIKRTDNAGNTTCYSYDAIHRVVSESYSGPNASGSTTPTFVQSTYGAQNANATSFSKAFSSNVTAGDLLFITFANSTANSISSVSDTLGNTYTALPLNTGNGYRLQAFYTFSTASGPDTVTGTYTGSGATYIQETLAEYANVGALDVHTENSGGNSQPSTTTTTTSSSDLVLGYVTDSFVNWTGETGWNLRTTASGIRAALQDTLAANPGSITSSFNQVNGWDAGIVAFKPGTSGANKYFIYDNATVNSVAMHNTMGRLAEAYTASTKNGNKITDLGFSYTARGETSDTYESTPHSTVYYHNTATYWEDGELKTLDPYGNLPQISFGVDPEGRRNVVSDSNNGGGSPFINNVLFNPASQITSMSVGVSGSAAASPSWTYDTGTGRLNNMNAGLNGGNTYSNALTWNPNGSLQKLVITDTLNASDNQTCNYSHDDLQRIASVNCGSIWTQSFTYDPFGNISSSGTWSWNPGYSSTTNRYSLGTTSYDANGNLLKDTFHAYTWFANGHPATIDSYGYVYDALDRPVETQLSGTAQSETNYFGKFKFGMNGANSLTTELLLIDGVKAIYNSGGSLSQFRLTDWLGSPRLNISYTGGGFSKSHAYSPFGMAYANSGGYGFNFTDQPSFSDGSTNGLLEYGFPARQLHPLQGRWLSPDPAGLRSVSLTRPQSWNRYAYALNNPLSIVDPLGLWCVWEDGTHDDDPKNGGESQDACFSKGGHWDPYDTITGIFLNDDGDILQINFLNTEGKSEAYLPVGMTLEGFDQTLQSYSVVGYDPLSQLNSDFSFSNLDLHFEFAGNYPHSTWRQWWAAAYDCLTSPDPLPKTLKVKSESPADQTDTLEGNSLDRSNTVYLINPGGRQEAVTGQPSPGLNNAANAAGMAQAWGNCMKTELGH